MKSKNISLKRESYDTYQAVCLRVESEQIMLLGEVLYRIFRIEDGRYELVGDYCLCKTHILTRDQLKKFLVALDQHPILHYIV